MIPTPVFLNGNQQNRKKHTMTKKDNGIIFIDRSLCDICGTCVGICPCEAFFLDRFCLEYYPERCSGCFDCLVSCPMGALKKSKAQTP